MPASIPRVSALRDEIQRLGTHTEIEIDGGIGVANARDVVEAGVEVLVAGSAAFKDGKVRENVAALRSAAEGN